ncbi:MAG: ABC transporter ATP-binding protein, partial [Clostridia bacterium]|nr:ABC transporter ATP-binding protein [Clostridia bacterium]
EPVNGLDIEGVVEIREIIKRLNEERGVTFLISSHMASEIEKTCNKVAVMYEGELIANSATEDAMRLHPSMEDYFLSVVKEKRGEVII